MATGPCPRLYVMPTERLTASQLAKPEWPSLPGWFNPLRQPPHRPAFAIEDSSGGSEEEDEGGGARASPLFLMSQVLSRHAALPWASPAQARSRMQELSR